MSSRWSIWRGGRGVGRGRGRGRWAWCAGAALALLAACAVRLPTAERRERVRFERVQPARLAHLLADFTLHPHGGGGGAGGWRVEEERGNYTWWWYRVSFACGARCAGEARVAAGERRVALRVTLCTTPPLLPALAALAYCDELEVESAVLDGDGDGGSVVEERARARCCAARVLAGACSRVLDAHRALHRAALLYHARTLPSLA